MIFHWTTAETAIVASAIPAISYFCLARKSNAVGTTASATKDQLDRVEARQAAFHDTFSQHALEDVQAFTELRVGQMLGRKRRPRWMLPALAMLTAWCLKGTSRRNSR